MFYQNKKIKNFAFWIVILIFAFLAPLDLDIKLSNGVNILNFKPAYAASGTVLDFDGNDYLSAADNAIFDQADRLSISVWLEPDDTPTDDEYIVYRYNNYYIKMNTSKQIVAAVYGAAWATATSTAVTCDGATWTHIEMTYDKDAGGTDELKLYINGNLSAVADYSTAIPASTKKLYIGSGDEAGDNTPEKGFDGQIDDVRLYSYARSASDVRLDYNEGLAVHLGPTGKTCSENPVGCMDYGLVGYWGMDEGNGTKAYDASGNSNNGTLTNGPKWSKGKISGGLSFDGTNDYVDCGDVGTVENITAITVTAWVYLSDITADHAIVAKYDADGVEHTFLLMFDDVGYSSGRTDMFKVIVKDNAGDYAEIEGATNSAKLNQWQFITLTFQGSSATGLHFYINGIEDANSPVSTATVGETRNTAYPLLIGAASASSGKTKYMKGTIDEVRIYNRALTAEEIRYQYNRGEPVAEWKFDEGVGDKAYDESPNNNDGLLGGGTADYKPTWVSGKYGSALSFDGDNDYVDCGNNASLNITSAITIEAWVYRTSAKPYAQIVGKGTDQSDIYNPYNIRLNANGDLAMIIIGNGTASPASLFGVIPLNTWTHLVGVANATTIWAYVNGVLVDTDARTGAFTTTGSSLTIGRPTSLTDPQYFNGTIDDVRIYNYARSAEQIRIDYQQGLSTHLK